MGLVEGVLVIFSGDPRKDAEQLNRLIYFSHGSPEGKVVAAAPAICFNLDAGFGVTLYVKESGTGATGWSAV